MRADQIVGGTAINFLALGVTGYFYIQIYGLNGTPGTGVPYIPDVKLYFLTTSRRTATATARASGTTPSAT